MRIAMLGTLTDEQNGSARLFYRLCTLLGRNDEIIPFIPDTSGVGRWIQDELPQTHVHQLNPLRMSLKSVLPIAWQLKSLLHRLQEIKPDLVYVADIPWCYLAPFVRRRGVPVLVHSQFFVPNPMLRTLVRPFLMQSSGVIHVSRRNQQLWGFPGDKLPTHAIHNPGIFQFEYQEQLVEHLPERYLLVVTRISPEKGILQALQLFEGVAAKDRDISLVIAGDAIYPKQARYKEECRQYVQERGLSDRVIWLGKVDSPHVLYTRAQAFLHLPQCEDSFPTTVMEALALGCPVITADRGGIGEQVEGFEGVLLTDAQYPEPERVARFLKDCRGRAFDRSRQYRQRFGEDAFIEKVRNVIAMIVQKNQA
jgi:glycosyltransferase involved in cell wall biosynthesis